jgi:hypothetical protein
VTITARISSEGPVLFPVFSQFHDRTEPISQLELGMLLSMRNRLRQVEEQVVAAEADLKARLEAGVEVEPGVHVVQLKESFRKSVSWKDVTIRLANRLKLNGEAYCAKVLAATKPSRSVLLEVR